MKDFELSSMDEIMIRFPVLFQGILKELDNKSLTKCRKIDKKWQNFIDNERFFLFRKLQKYHSNMEEFFEQWKKATQGASIETIGELSVAVLKFFEDTTYWQDTSTYFCFYLSTRKKKDEQWSPLHITAEQGHLELSKYIIEKTGDKNPKNRKGDTALQMSAEKGQLEVSKLIIENLEDKNPRGYEGWTALHFAANNGHLEVCRLINDSIDDGATVTCLINNFTPVDCAAVGGHLEVFKLLAETLENKNQAVNANNWTPLHSAASGGHLELCRYIVDSGADKRPIGNGYFLRYAGTPLAAAAGEGHLKTCKFFIEEWRDLIQFLKGIVFTKNIRVIIYAAVLFVILFSMFITIPFFVLLGQFDMLKNGHVFNRGTWNN